MLAVNAAAAIATAKAPVAKDLDRMFMLVSI
jgi:hypothetical protein